MDYNGIQRTVLDGNELVEIQSMTMLSDIDMIFMIRLASEKKNLEQKSEPTSEKYTFYQLNAQLANHVALHISSPGVEDFALSLRPDYHKAIMDIIIYYQWANVLYIYDSHDVLLRVENHAHGRSYMQKNIRKPSEYFQFKERFIEQERESDVTRFDFYRNRYSRGNLLRKSIKLTNCLKFNDWATSGLHISRRNLYDLYYEKKTYSR
ncbi:unnamed protein product [Leptidea sinapis]|uniref:Receptor ligand binding region domain-containing protein n=1 Tax=Leptidea sinapis TaxID=189913 RepID=A0A5E4Q8P4_9NEOP|nr:unnamed protein product [Leptidea sinapis]